MDSSFDERTDNGDVTMLEDYKASKKKLRPFKGTKDLVSICEDDMLLSDDEDDDDIEKSTSDSKNNTISIEEKISLEQTIPEGSAPTGYEIVDEVYSDKEIDVEDKPLVRITFRDNDIAGRYKKKFLSFLNDLIMKNNKNCMTQWKDLVLEVWGSLCENETTDDCPNVSKDKAQDEFESLFVIDTKPALKDELEIPTYGRKYSQVLDQNNTAEKKTTGEKVSKFTCFNCMGKHNLKDCTQPRNQANINKNRKEFTAKQTPRNLRYHQEDDQRFGNFVPGQLSKNLRQALSLKDSDLPRHIYNMRNLGYPPGWLEEAKLQHSGLSLFNSDGVAEGDPDDEEGEIVNLQNKDKYDIKKIIDFPGFNIRPPRGIHDECKQYWGSECQISNSKAAMLKHLSDKKVDDGYKKQKLKKCVPITLDTTIESKEMDIEVLDDDVVIESVPINGLFIPPLPKEDVKPPEPPAEDSDGQESLSPESTHEESTAPSSRAESPSLSDLEYTKKHILAELEDSSSQSNCENISKNTSLDTSISGIDMPPPENDVVLPGKSNSKSNTPVSNRGNIKMVDLGTPILKSASPFNKLPSSEKFSKNICDVIYFENLPDAIGKYEQMSGIIQKVRSKLAEINKE